MESPHQETKNDPHAVDVLRSKTVGSCDVDEVSGSGTASSDERSGLKMDREEERGSWELLASLTDHAQANQGGWKWREFTAEQVQKCIFTLFRRCK